jgi:type II secretory ATPase GspE/PulE/Tfp pilus assembly ATPase PilB-like protein
MINKTLGQILISKNVIAPKDLEFCLAVKKADPAARKIGHYIVYYNFAQESDIAGALSDASGYEYFRGEYIPDMELVKKLKIEFIIGRKIYPLQTESKPAFILTDVLDTDTTDYLEANFGSEIGYFVAPEDEVVFAIETLIREINRTEAVEGITISEDLPADKLAQQILEYAVSCSASDIHIEPSETVVEIRLRVDGVMQFYRTLALDALNRLVNVFFHKAQIGSSDFLQFHDSSFDFNFLGHEIDVRLSHIPGVNGSSLVLRLLDRTKSTKSLQSLGYAKEHWDILHENLNKPNGIILMTGPTGCGKSTSLYAMVNFKKGIGIKILSVEDPIEVRLPLVTQVPVNIKKGHTFAAITRAFLRHDPDIILIGEIRDGETAHEAMRASGTGHLVFSTLHTNDPVSALLRLHDLGVDYSYIASSVRCIVSQRLVRKLCPFCKEKKRVTRKNIDVFAAKYLIDEEQEIYVPRGCKKCSGGYWGRTVVAETLCIDDEIQFLIEQQKINEISLRLKEQKDYLTIQKDASRLISESVLSLEEAVRILG